VRTVDPNGQCHSIICQIKGVPKHIKKEEEKEEEEEEKRKRKRGRRGRGRRRIRRREIRKVRAVTRCKCV
jgi:hypothetical protein